MDILASFPREHRLKGFIYENPSVIFAILASYLAISLVIGPAFMRNRRPYNVRTFTRLYNLFQVGSVDGLGMNRRAFICSWYSRMVIVL